MLKPTKQTNYPNLNEEFKVSFDAVIVNHLLKNQQPTDVIIEGDDFKVNCHRSVLEVVPHIRQILSEHVKSLTSRRDFEEQGMVIKLPSHFERNETIAIVNYLYYGHCQSNAEIDENKFKELAKFLGVDLNLVTFSKSVDKYVKELMFKNQQKTSSDKLRPQILNRQALSTMLTSTPKSGLPSKDSHPRVPCRELSLSFFPQAPQRLTNDLSSGNNSTLTNSGSSSSNSGTTTSNDDVSSSTMQQALEELGNSGVIVTSTPITHDIRRARRVITSISHISTNEIPLISKNVNIGPRVAMRRKEAISSRYNPISIQYSTRLNMRSTPSITASDINNKPGNGFGKTVSSRVASKLRPLAERSEAELKTDKKKSTKTTILPKTRAKKLSKNLSKESKEASTKVSSSKVPENISQINSANELKNEHRISANKQIVKPDVPITLEGAPDGLARCSECGKDFKGTRGLTVHMRRTGHSSN